MTGEIPQSEALKETHGDSLAEVMARDPEGLSRQDRDRIIEALRAQRARLATAEASAPKKSSGPKVPLAQQTAKSVHDMGL